MDEIDLTGWLSYEQLNEERWETPLKPIEIIRAELSEDDLPF
jgi:hypothetical protein